MFARSTLEKTDKVEKIIDPEKWLKGQKLDDKKGDFFSIVYPTRADVEISGQDISEHYKRIKLSIPEIDRWMPEVLVAYVRAPTIQDRFPTEELRNKWQHQAVHPLPDVNKLFESNKLKGNTISGVFGVAEMGMMDGWLSSSLTTRYAQLLAEYDIGPDGPPRNYDKKTIEEKILFTKKMVDFAKDLYLALVARYPNSVLQ